MSTFHLTQAKPHHRSSLVLCLQSEVPDSSWTSHLSLHLEPHLITLSTTMQSHSFHEQSGYPATPEEFRMLPALFVRILFTIGGYLHGISLAWGVSSLAFGNYNFPCLPRKEHTGLQDPGTGWNPGCTSTVKPTGAGPKSAPGRARHCPLIQPAFQTLLPYLFIILITTLWSDVRRTVGSYPRILSMEN